MSEPPDPSPADDPLAALRTEPSANPWGGVRAVVTTWPIWAQAAAGSAVIAIVAAVGIATVPRRESPPPELTLPTASAVSLAGGEPSSSSTVTASALVHAAGAVVRPRLYELPPGSRVDDVLTAAGGPTADADLDRLNLAATVTDGERVWVPHRGEVEPPTVVGGGNGRPEGRGAGEGESAGPIDLNSATADELDTLPGVGPATAEAIIEHREANGPFTSVEQLIDVRGIGEAKLAQLRDLVRV